MQLFTEEDYINQYNSYNESQQKWKDCHTLYSVAFLIFCSSSCFLCTLICILLSRLLLECTSLAMPFSQSFSSGFLLYWIYRHSPASSSLWHFNGWVKPPSLILFSWPPSSLSLLQYVGDNTSKHECFWNPYR